MNVVVMRRSLSEEELVALQQMHPGEEIVPHTTSPESAADHLADCRRLGAHIAFLPHEQPIPIPAMREGVKHLLLKDGKLLELVSVIPQFRSYEHE